MQVVVLSITPLADAPCTSTQGRYRVVLQAGDAVETLTYRVEIDGGYRALSWQPTDTILSDPRLDVLTVAAINDLVVRFHRQEFVQLPSEVPPKVVDDDTEVIRL